MRCTDLKMFIHPKRMDPAQTAHVSHCIVHTHECALMTRWDTGLICMIYIVAMGQKGPSSKFVIHESFHDILLI